MIGWDQECTPDSFAPGVCNFVVHPCPVGRAPSLMSLGVGEVADSGSFGGPVS